MDISEVCSKAVELLCHAGQVIELTEYRASLYDYLKHRMMAIAPNVTALVGELVGARLISHAGMNSLLLFIQTYFIQRKCRVHTDCLCRGLLNENRLVVNLSETGSGDCCLSCDFLT